MALLVIGRCGFGFQFDWSAPPVGPDGKITIQEALRVLADSYIIGMMMPDWVRYLPFPGFSRIRDATDEFTGFMSREISIREEEVRNGSELADQRVDAFTMLVRANEQETDKLKLTDQEVIGNVFIMLFAGHGEIHQVFKSSWLTSQKMTETTAHTLSATLALLALHQDIQTEILEHIVEVVGYEHDPMYNDYDKLNKVLATFLEALRLFPPAYITIRKAAEDTILNIPNPVGEEGNTPLAVQKGTRMVFDFVGMQYNPRYFADPEEFRPSRWYNTSSESEAFSAFSLGPRACIGRKFATVEAVGFLTMLLRDWHVEPIFKSGETAEAWRERVLSKPILGLTLGVRGAPVKLTRRQVRR
ncbi:hypothetical protein H0H87_007745 [Tephrocybe sp. NHM501043]|nr:hypothetical protein H0H87_007745 [Tephrocybe sp. NHM501043]